MTTRRATAVAAAACLLPRCASAAAAFRAIPCPSGGFADGCTYRNAGAADEAVSLFFQFEPAQGEERGAFHCSGDGITYCSRAWEAAASGSAGDCFFLLGAGRSFACAGTGTVNVLGAHAALLSAALVAPQPQQAEAVPCGDAGCSWKNTGGDAWVGIAVSAAGRGSAACHAAGVEVCSWAADAAGGAGSCGFVLGAGAELRCSGNATFAAAAALRLAAPLLDPDAVPEKGWDCPNVTYPSANMCDCSFTNPHADRDLAVAVSAESVDDNFNSFHCYYGGANVCAWGSNRGNRGDRGGCYFLLAAGETLACQMEWGAAAFSASAAFATRRSLFGSTAPPPAAQQQKAGARIPAGPAAGLQRAWAVWRQEHGKVYATAAEEEQRFANFRAHVAVAGRRERYNHLADLSLAEFEAAYRGCAHAPAPPRNASALWRPRLRAALPASVDWRASGSVTGVKDQGQCGACWSFSATGAVESAWAIAGNPLQSISEQQLVSCDKAGGNAGCDGGWPDKAMEWIRAHGADTEAGYPYVSGAGHAPGCTGGHPAAAARVGSVVPVAQDEDAMAAYVAQHGPLSISVAAMTQLWWPYTGGIMTGCCNKDPDHAVLIVGYGEEAGQKYWLIKNSWATKWGEGGYLRLERGTNQCGITAAAVAPVIAGGPVPPAPPSPMPPPATPAPRRTPSPQPGACPAEAVAGASSCTWVNGTHGVVLPPASAVTDYCNYFGDGYFGYLWPSTAGAAPCPAAAVGSASGGNQFCVFDNGARGVAWPAGARADCSALTDGRIGFAW